MDHSLARPSRRGFSPGVLLGLALALVQAVLQSLLAPDFAIEFLLPVILLYLFIPFCFGFFIDSRTGRLRITRSVGWRSGLTCALMLLFADLLLAIVVLFLVRSSPYGGETTAGLIVFSDLLGAYAALLGLNVAGILLTFVGTWLGAAMGRRLARAQNAPQARRLSERYYPLGCWGYLLFLPLAALLTGVQLVAETSFALGLLPELQAVYAAPPDAFDPSNPTVITLSTWQGQLYAHALPHAYVVRARDGSVMRTLATDPFGSYQGVLYTSEGQAFAADSYRTIQAIRESDGKQLWSYAFPEQVQSIQLVGGVIYYNFAAGAQTGMLGAIDALTGHNLWHYPCSGCYVTPPRVSNGIVYTSNTELNQFVALRASDGSVIWTANQAFSTGSYLLRDHQIILQNTVTTLAALDPATGHPLWQVSLPHDEQNTPLLVDSAENIDLFLLITSTGLAVRSLAGGSLLWQQPLTSNRQQVFLTAQTVYVVQLLQVKALRASDGAALWTYTLDKPLHSSDESLSFLGESQGVLYIQPWVAPIDNTDASLLIALRVADGGVAWQRRFRLPAFSTNTVSGQPRTTDAVAPALLVGDSLYFAYQTIVSNAVPLFRLKISMLPVVSAALARTTFMLAAFDLDARSGNTRWQQQYVESYPVG